MKKMLSFVIALIMIFGVIQVNAAIDYDKVKALPVKKISRTSGAITVSYKGEVDGIKDVYNIYGGGATGRVTGKFQIELSDIPSGVAAGDYIYIKFYYRINSKYTDGVTDTVNPGSFFPYPKFGATSGTGNFGYSSGSAVKDTWYMGTIKTTLEAATATFQRFVMIFQAGEYVNIDLGGVSAMYIGPVTYTSDDSLNVEGQINELISTASFSSIKFDGKEIDLSANPDSYSTKIGWTGKLPEIVAVDGMGNTIKVNPDTDIVYDGKLPKTVYLTAYALDQNIFDPGNSSKKVYTINIDYHRVLTNVTVNGSSVTFDADIYNLNNENLNYTAVICIYDKTNGKCIAAVPYKISVPEEKDSDIFSFTYPGDRDYTDYDCKAFIISPVGMFKIN